MLTWFQHSCWLCVVVDNSAQSLTTCVCAWRQLLSGHDIADTNNKLWSLLTDFNQNEIIYSSVFPYPSSNILKIRKWGVASWIRTVRTRALRTLRSNIFAKTNYFVKPFVPVHKGRRLSKKLLKFRDSVPFKLHSTWLDTSYSRTKYYLFRFPILHVRLDLVFFLAFFHLVWHFFFLSCLFLRLCIRGAGSEIIPEPEKVKVLF